MNRTGSLNPNWRGGICKDYYRYKLIQMRRYPQKMKARALAYAAIRSGKLLRQDCEECGDPKTQTHHPDYRSPMKIKWLCVKCHRDAHNGIGVGRVKEKR